MIFLYLRLIYKGARRILQGVGDDITLPIFGTGVGWKIGSLKCWVVLGLTPQGVKRLSKHLREEYSQETSSHRHVKGIGWQKRRK